jgi:hypothetical protein
VTAKQQDVLGRPAVLIALVLIHISLRLIQRCHDFLSGAWGAGHAAMTLLASPSHPARTRRAG